MNQKLIQHVVVDDGAVMSIMAPMSFADGGMSWLLRYANPDMCKIVGIKAASVLDSYDYLLSDAITTKEAIRRLRILRNARNGVGVAMTTDKTAP